MANFDIAVLGAGKLDKSFKEEKIESKAYLSINGKFMAEYPLKILSDIDYRGNIIFAAPSEKIPESVKRYADKTCLGGKTIIESLINAAKLCDKEYLAVSACDIPLITYEALDDFFKKSLESNSDFCYSFVRKEISERKYPRLKHTYVKLKDGTFCGGSCVMIRRDKLEGCLDAFKFLSEGRKQPLKLVSFFGLINIAKFIAHTLSIEDLKRKADILLNAKTEAVESLFPEMAFNVDEEETLKRAETELLKKAEQTAEQAEKSKAG